MSESEFLRHVAVMNHESILGERVERLLAEILAAIKNQWRTGTPVRGKDLIPAPWVSPAAPLTPDKAIAYLRAALGTKGPANG